MELGFYSRLYASTQASMTASGSDKLRLLCSYPRLPKYENKNSRYDLPNVLSAVHAEAGGRFCGSMMLRKLLQKLLATPRKTRNAVRGSIVQTPVKKSIANGSVEAIFLEVLEETSLATLHGSLRAEGL